MTSHPPIGYAVVGLGWISQAAVLPAFANTRADGRLVALVSGSEGKRRALAERYGLEAAGDTYDYAEFEACLDREDVDAVYLAVPNHLHRTYTERAAARGVHVLCEKPMAVTDEDCRAMIRACEDADVRLMIAYRLHFDPANLALVDAVGSGAIGEPRVFNATFSQQVRDGDIRLMPPAKGGGPLYDIGIYCINAARYLFRAEPTFVRAVSASRPQPRFSDAEETVSCVLGFPGDRLAAFTCSFGAHPVSELNLVGDDGALRMDHAFNFVGDRHLRFDGGDDRTFPTTDQFGPLLTRFADCVRESRAPEPDGEEGRVDVRIIQTLYDAMDRGGAVDLDVPRRGRRPTPEQAMSFPAIEAPELVEETEPSGE